MTKELTPEHIQHNWGNLMRIIDMHFSGERLEKLKTMYDYFEAVSYTHLTLPTNREV